MPVIKESHSPKNWKVIDWGVNGQPFLWRARARKRFVMIDIFNPDSLRRCYPVLVLRKHPDFEGKKEVIGFGCADETENGWELAYQRARRIAEEFMAKT